MDGANRPKSNRR